jgi:hypothetical protein
VDDVDRHILALAAEGFSDRQIAREVGLSRSGVRKRRAKRSFAELCEAELVPVDDEPDPWTDAELDDEAEDADYDPMDDLPPRPWTYHGTERVRLDMGRGEQPKFERGEVWTDANGERVNFGLEAYRFRTYTLVAGEHDEASQEAVRAFDADCDRSREAYERDGTGWPRDANGLGVAGVAVGTGRGRCPIAVHPRVPGLSEPSPLVASTRVHPRPSWPSWM